MRRQVTISSILSWINLVFWGLACIFLLLATAGGGILFLIMAFFMSAIPLHSYAAIQFHKHLKNPAVPLKRQTLSGLRFMGFVVIFFGITMLINSVAALQNTKELLKAEQEMMSRMPQAQNMTEGTIRAAGVLGILLGLSLLANVILNTRLLRWYYVSKEQENKEQS